MKNNHEKPICYSCKFKGDVPGSAHSSCLHPSLEKVVNNPYGQILATVGGGKMGGVFGPLLTANAIDVKAHAHGIAMGWFCHPWNFDPVWLEECSGYEQKES